MRDRIFLPAILLMNRLNYLQKFFIVAVLLLLPSIGLLYILNIQINEDIAFSSKELTGITYNTTLRQFLESAQKHRELSLRYVLGDSSVVEDIKMAQAEVEQTILGVDSADSQFGDQLSVREQWKNLKIEWKNLKSRTFSYRAERNGELLGSVIDRSVESQNSFIDGILSLVVDVADNSNLTLDSKIETYYLMTITNFKVLQLNEALSQSKNLMRRTANMTQLSAEYRTAFNVQAGVISPLLSDISDAVNRINTYTQKVSPQVEPTYVDLKASADQYLEILQSEILIDSLRGNRSSDLGILERPIRAGYEVFDIQYPILREFVVERIDNLQNRQLLFFVLTPGVILLVSYLLGGFYSSVVRTVHTLEDVAKQLEAGKVTQVVEVETRDELGRVGHSFNQIAVSLLNRNKELDESRTQLENSNKALRETQTALVQGEKMASLGQMVAGLAHEINTPLGYVKNNIEMMISNQDVIVDAMEKYRRLLDQLVNGEEAGLEDLVNELANLSTELEKNTVLEDSKTMLSQALVGSERIQELIKNLRDFSRLDEADFAKVDINKSIDATLVIANNAIKNKAVIKKDFQPNLTAECYPAQFNQVILNLITNAAQAIDGQGTISIRTFKEPGNPDMAVIRIGDTGKGIPRENLARIFEPFFTTKKIGEGTGLGLSISYKIVEKHNGSITVDSEVGRGTEFTVKIPLIQPRVNRPAQPVEQVSSN